MNESKETRLRRGGWRVGNVSDLLELSPDEAAFLEVKRALSDSMRQLRVKKRWTQTLVARLLGSSQSRVAKMEAADPSVSLDLLAKSLLSLGATRKDLARAISRGT
jgi:DNA-binding XRE family transcriptional regulator